MPFIVDDLILASLIIGTATAGAGVYQQASAANDADKAARKREAAEQKAAAAEARAAKLKHTSELRKQFKLDQMTRARQAALAGQQLGSTEAASQSSALAGAQGTTSGTAAESVSYANQAYSIGQDIGSAQVDRFRADQALNAASNKSEIGSALFNLGGTIINNSSRIGSIGQAGVSQVASRR
jgi:hypothetical protein